MSNSVAIFCLKIAKFSLKSAKRAATRAWQATAEPGRRQGRKYSYLGSLTLKKNTGARSNSNSNLRSATGLKLKLTPPTGLTLTPQPWCRGAIFWLKSLVLFAGRLCRRKPQGQRERHRAHDRQPTLRATAAPPPLDETPTPRREHSVPKCSDGRPGAPTGRLGPRRDGRGRAGGPGPRRDVYGRGGAGAGARRPAAPLRPGGRPVRPARPRDARHRLPVLHAGRAGGGQQPARLAAARSPVDRGVPRGKPAPRDGGRRPSPCGNQRVHRVIPQETSSALTPSSGRSYRGTVAR